MTVPLKDYSSNPAYLRSDVTAFLAAPWAEEAIGPPVGNIIVERFGFFSRNSISSYSRVDFGRFKGVLRRSHTAIAGNSCGFETIAVFTAWQSLRTHREAF